MTDKQINLAIGAIIHAELVMDFSDVILDALNSVIAFLATMDEQPERKKGKWIEITNTDHTYICSVCGRMLVNISDGKNNVAKSYPFCHCGADMKGEHDE